MRIYGKFIILCMKRSEIKAKKYEDSLDYYHYTGDEPSVAYTAGYEQAEKDMMLEMRQWILRQRGFGKVALQDFEKYMRGNGHE